MFMRESSGVYEFGSRRVMVKVEREKIQIKVGGGFLSIDEFLDQYTPVELEKLERKDPLKRFNERVAVQKTINDRMGVETSPVRRQDSPTNKRMPSPAKKTPSAKTRTSKSNSKASASMMQSQPQPQPRPNQPLSQEEVL